VIASAGRLIDALFTVCHTPGMEREPKSVMLVARVRPSLKAAIERAAVADQRSVSSLIEKLLTDHLAGLENAPRRPSRPPGVRASAGRTRQ
jgi:hypothetical protein